MNTGKTLTEFDHIWEDLAEQGQCDSLGGMEYARVKEEWRTFTLAAFIRWRANIGPHDKSLEEGTPCAGFIAKAVNSYEAMKEAIEGLLAYSDRNNAMTIQIEKLYDHISNLRKALAKGKEPTP